MGAVQPLTKAITIANHKKGKQQNDAMRNRSKYT